LQTPGDLSLSAAHELGSLIERFTGTDGVHTTSIPRVFLLRSSHPTEQLHAVQEPAICIVAQGRKQVMAGTSVYLYDRAKYLIASVDIPIVGQILEASPAAPYLCLRLDLDPSVIGALMLEAEVPKTASDTPASALSLSTVTPELLDAAIRLVRLLTAPRDIPILAPLAEREILYRLLLGDQSSKLRQIAVAESKLQQINRAIGWIKRHFRDSFSNTRSSCGCRKRAGSFCRGRSMRRRPAIPWVMKVPRNSAGNTSGPSALHLPATSPVCAPHRPGSRCCDGSAATPPARESEFVVQLTPRGGRPPRCGCRRDP
jgi:hypothetical protein